MNRIRTLLVALVLALMAARTQAAPAGPGKRIVETFDYQGVTLEDGELKRQFDETRNYYLHIPNDDLLKGFRMRFGSPAPGVALGGWYTSDTFHIFGQILSGLARMYAATGDPACREKVGLLIQEWGKCVEADGYFYFSHTPNARHYIYDKMVGGLVDAILYCHNAEAVGYLRRITDWAVKHLDRTRPYGADSNEWYTLSENLYRAYLATNDPKYRDFARIWEYTEYWNRYAQKRDLFLGGPTAYHAYSHVNTLGGAGAAYLVTGETHYLDTLRNAYDFLQTTVCFATGGFGPNEQITPPAARRQMMETSHATFETQCGSWAAFKMTKYLLSLTGNARYGDWTERLVLNGIGASVPMSGDGRVLYYSDYNPAEGAKTNCGQGWSCCAGTRPEAIADYYDLIYLHAATGLYVNLYTPSSVRWTPAGGSALTVRQTTRFPADDKVEFTVQTARPNRFGLYLRAPGWLAGRASVELNGKPIYVIADANHWFAIRRTWKEGDRLTLHLPMKLHAERLDADQPYPAAILYGPVALATRTPKGNPARKIDLAHLEQTFAPSQAEPLTYRLRTDPNVLLRPFAAYREGEPYYLYLDPSTENRVSYRALTFSPGWSDSGQFRFGNTVGATVGYTFEGIGIRWMGYRFDDAGKAEVRIDGKVVATVDQYGPGRELPFHWEYRGLTPGKHTIQLTLLPDKNPASRDRFLNIAGFEAQPDIRIETGSSPPCLECRTVNGRGGVCMRIGIFTKVFERATLADRLDAVRTCGLDCVQFDLSCVGVAPLPDRIDAALCDPIRNAFATSGVTMSAVNGTFNMIHPTSHMRRDGLRRLHELARACPLLGTSVITLCTGTRDPVSMWRRHADNDAPDAWNDLLHTMEEALTLTEETGVTLAFEPEVSNVVDSARKARLLLDMLRSPRLKVVMDGANLFHAGELPHMRVLLEEAIDLLGPDIVLAHAKDLDHDGDAGNLAAGTGLLDYPLYLSLLQQAGFTGPLILHGLSEAQARDAIAFVRNTLMTIA